jgi:hypothetical protein
VTYPSTLPSSPLPQSPPESTVEQTPNPSSQRKSSRGRSERDENNSLSRHIWFIDNDEVVICHRIRSRHVEVVRHGEQVTGGYRNLGKDWCIRCMYESLLSKVCEWSRVLKNEDQVIGLNSSGNRNRNRNIEVRETLPKRG